MPLSFAVTDGEGKKLQAVKGASAASLTGSLKQSTGVTRSASVSVGTAAATPALGGLLQNTVRVVYGPSLLYNVRVSMAPACV